MKRLSLLLIILVIIFYNYNVFAQDTVVSMNKYSEEKFTSIETAYDSEGNKDGFITGGYILKETIEIEDEKYNDYQAIVVKYDMKNKMVWKYLYGKNKEDYLDYLNYSYDSEGKINGYLLVVVETNDILEESSNESVFIKLSLDGKEEYVKPLGLAQNIRINKFITTYNDNGIDGYLAIGNNDNNSYLIKLDKELNVVWNRVISKEEYTSINYLDLTTITKDNKIVGYAILKELITGDNKKIELIRYNIDGEEPITINEELSKYDSYSLVEASDGFIIYGATSEVKLKKGDYSYYLINYNSNNENYWETIGDSPLDKDKVIKLLPIKTNSEIKEYLLLYSNNIAKSSEIVRIGTDGSIEDKVNKIYDEYYSITDFTFDKDILYLVGQINCPKDDTCAYDSNSLFLVSNQEKVIEVKDNDSKNILITIGIFIIFIIGIIIYRKKKAKYV